MKSPTVKFVSGDRIECEAIAVACFERSMPDAGPLGGLLGAAIAEASSRPGWKALEDQVTRAVIDDASRRALVEVHGLGKRTAFTSHRLKRWLARVTDQARAEGRRAIGVVLPRHPVTEGRAALRILSQLLGSGYRFERFRRRDERPALRTVYLWPPESETATFRAAQRLARPLARAVKLSRDLANTPPNEATPDWMAEQARALASQWSMECEVLEVADLEARGMGGILAVGRGSHNPPKLVRLEWGSGDEVVALVGKGVTFDTGGISIKPSRSMEEMKFDKCGACAVLGIAQASAELDLPCRFRAYLPLVENMPDGASYRPSDIVRCYNGRTVEILDTDAEGRLILADALAWAAEEKPDVVIEFSTLTGASVVALGHHGAALYSPDDALAEEFLQAAEHSGERLWRMPLWPEFGEEMEGVHGDLRNLGGRWGGANQAACFLGSFLATVRRWAHLDIAGTAYRASREEKTSEATGFGVALTVDWLLTKSERI